MVCVWKGQEGGCIYGMGEVCVHGERVGVCIWKGWSVRAWGEGECVYGRGGVCVHGERESVYMEGVECACMGRGMMLVYGRGGVCVHANSAPNYLTLSFLCRFVSGSQDYAYPNCRGHNINFARQHQLTY